MEYVNISKFPNYKFTLVLSSRVLTFELSYFRGMTYCSVFDQEDKAIVLTKPCLHKEWILPKTAEPIYGNFRFEDENEEYPVYSNFDTSCFLCHYSKSEADSASEAQALEMYSEEYWSDGSEGGSL